MTAVEPIADVSKKPKRGWIKRVFRVLIIIFIVLHAYMLVLRFVPVPGTFLMVQRAVQGETIKKDWTRIEDISPNMISAVIAAEDARFCSHEGIDLKAIEDAIEDNDSRKRRRGGSTITQQTAKNVFLWNGGGLMRKAAEAWFATAADFVWGKRRTMEIYLNVAEWGDGIFGVEAAAQHRFGKSAADLTRWEAALLASVLPSPNKWRIDPPGDYVQGRARTLQARLQVVRNEGYDACVLGAAPKIPVKKPKPSIPKVEPEPEPEQVETANEPTVEPEIEPADIEIEELEPALPEASEESEAPIAPESEDEDTPSVTIPEPE